MRYLPLAALLLAFPAYAHDPFQDLEQRLSDVTAKQNELSDTQKALTSTVGNHTSDIADLLRRVDALEKKPQEPPPTDPPETPRTANEQAVLEAVTPFLALDNPGPDIVACEAPWFCVSDLTTNPEHADRAFGSIQAADRAWVSAGRPADGGIVWMPGRHKMRNLGPENFARAVLHFRSQNKTNPSVIDCKDGWQRTDFCVHQGAGGTLVHEGYVIENAFCNKRCGGIGANSDGPAKNLVLIDMEIRSSDNGIRGTGGWVAMFRTKLIGNSRTNVAHNAYISNDNRRGKHCPMVIAVDVVSTGPITAHALKFRCKIGYVLRGRYEDRNGFAIDNAEGGQLLVEGAEIVQQRGGKQWVVVAHGLDKLERDTGFARGNDIHRQHEITDRWRGQTTLRDVTFTNENSPGFAGIWNDSRYREPVKNPDGSLKQENGRFVYDNASEVFRPKPVELINVTVDGEPADESDVKGPVEIVQ